MAAVFSVLLNALFPYRCPLCRNHTKPACFCTACQGNMPQKPLTRTFSFAYNGERKELLCCSAVPYTGAYRSLLHRLKFRGSLTPVNAMAERMAWCAQGYGITFDIVCFVPMQTSEKRKRGYNQSEVLAKQLAKTMRLPLQKLLKKTRKTQTQHTLNFANRTDNVAAAFAAASRFSLGGCTVLLVDDIVTTGATLCACAEALYAAGAKKVCAVCFADTPKT